MRAGQPDPDPAGALAERAELSEFDLGGASGADIAALPGVKPDRIEAASWAAAALGRDAVIDAPCGDCGEPMRLEVRGSKLVRSEGIVHFAVPAHRRWDNIGFT